MKIEISDISEKVVYIMDITDRITIIRGNSATGKSVLVRLIDNIGKSQVKVSAGIDIIHINSRLVLEGLPLREDRLYIMDEGDGIEHPEVIRKINDKRYKFILITRKEDFGIFSCDIYQIYHFRNSGKYHNLVRVYDKIDDNKNQFLGGVKMLKIYIGSLQNEIVSASSYFDITYNVK